MIMVLGIICLIVSVVGLPAAYLFGRHFYKKGTANGKANIQEIKTILGQIQGSYKQVYESATPEQRQGLIASARNCTAALADVINTDLPGTLETTNIFEPPPTGGP